MLRPWTKEDVHFLPEDLGNDEIWSRFAHRPHLSTCFDDSPGNNKSTFGRQHQHPKILALGIMLLEVELGLDLQVKWNSDDLRADGSPTCNTDYTTALGLLREKTLWADKETFPALKKAITLCVEGTEFENCTTPNEERDVLYQSVVRPLEDTWKITSNEGLEDLELALLKPMIPKMNAHLRPSPTRIPLSLDRVEDLDAKP